jgi:hypothetical protein
LIARIDLHLQERLAGIHRELDGLAAQVAREREERLRGLQLAARSLRQAESTAQWVQILADAAAPLADGVMFFRVDGAALRCEAARGMELVAGEVALADAPALRQAVETKETVVTLFMASQLSAAVVGETGGVRRRAQLFPLVGKTRVLGVLLALDGPGLEVYGLEVLLSLGAAALELREAKSGALIGPAAPVVAAAVPVVAAPAAAAVPVSGRAFARTVVARWILESGELVAAGRAAGDLYGVMRELVDGARAEFAARYGGGVDALHLEMVERLALGDAGLMGAGYPGPVGGARDA